MASAFMGGLATGFLNAKIRSEEAAAQAARDERDRIEKEKDRQLRREISDDQIEMQRQTLLNSQKDAQERRDFQIAQANFSQIQKIAPRGKNVDLVSLGIKPDVIQILHKLGYPVSATGTYNSEPLYAVKDAESQRALVTNQIQNMKNFGVPPSQLLPGVYPALKAGFGKNKLPKHMKDEATFLSWYDRGYKGRDLTVKINDWTKANGGKNPIVSINAQGVPKIEATPAIGMAAMEESDITFFAGIQSIGDKDLQKKLLTEANADPINWSELKAAEKRLVEISNEERAANGGRALPNDKRSDRYKKTKAYIISNLRSKYLTTQSNFVKNGNSFSVTDGTNTVVEQYEESFETLFPELYKIFKSGNMYSSGTLKPNVVTDPLKSIQNQVSFLVKQGSKKGGYNTAEEARAALENNQVNILRMEVRSKPTSKNDLVVSPQTVDTGKQYKYVITKYQDGGQQSVSVVQGDAVALKKKIIHAPDGTEKFAVGFQNGQIDTARLDKLFAYPEMLDANPNYFKNKPQEQAEYERLKPMYDVIAEYRRNPEDNTVRQKLKKMIVENFKGVVTQGTGNDNSTIDPDKLNEAVLQIVEQEMFDAHQKKNKVTKLGDGKGVRVTSFGLAGRDPKDYTELENTLREERNKLNDAIGNAKSYLSSINRIGGLNSLISLNPNEFGEQHIKAFNILASMRGDEELPPEIARIVNQTQRELTQSGFAASTDPNTGIARFFQKIKDITNALLMNSDNLKNVVDKGFITKGNGRLTSENFKSFNDQDNDEITKSRLRAVEVAGRQAAAAYRKNITDATTAAQQAFNNANAATTVAQKEQFTKEAVRQQAIALRNHLLAKNAMTKVTLTYTFAGMVQGESGGRAISNEDFAILYQAIWGGAGGDMGEGSFKRLEEILTDLQVRNDAFQRYLPHKEGNQMAREMISVHRSLLKDKYAKLYKESKGPVDLLQKLNMRDPDAPQRNIVAIPKNIIDSVTIDGSDRATAGMNDITLTNRSQDFTRLVAQPIISKFPTLKLMTVRTGGVNQASRTQQVITPFNKLAREDREKIIDSGIDGLMMVGYDRFGVATDNLKDLNMYSGNVTVNRQAIRVRLGDALAAQKRLEEAAISMPQQEYSRLLEKEKPSIIFLENIIKHMYAVNASKNRRNQGK